MTFPALHSWKSPFELSNSFPSLSFVDPPFPSDRHLSEAQPLSQTPCLPPPLSSFFGLFPNCFGFGLRVVNSTPPSSLPFQEHFVCKSGLLYLRVLAHPNRLFAELCVTPFFPEFLSHAPEVFSCQSGCRHPLLFIFFLKRSLKSLAFLPPKISFVSTKQPFL